MHESNVRSVANVFGCMIGARCVLPVSLLSAMAVVIPTKRFSGKDKPNSSNSKVVKSILKKEKKQVPEKTRKVQLPPEKVPMRSKAAEPKKVKKAKEEVEKSLKLEAMKKMKEQEKKKMQKVPTSKGCDKEKVKNDRKKGQKKGVAKEEGEPKTDYGKKNSIPVKYVPCKRKEVEDMFRTPLPKRSGCASSVSSQTSRKGKAPGKDASKDVVKKMEALLEESDNGCSDIDDILQGVGSQEPSDSEDEDEAEGEEGSDEGEQEECEDSDDQAEDQEDAEEEDNEDNEDQEGSQEESEEETEKESEKESEKGGSKDGEKVKDGSGQEASGAAGQDLVKATAQTESNTSKLKNSSSSLKA